MGLWPHFLAGPVQRRNQKSNQGRTTPRGPRGGQTEQLEQREIAGAYESSSTCSSFVGRSVGRRAEMKIYGQLAVARTSAADTSLGVLIAPCGQRRRPHIVIYAPLSAVSVLIRRSIYTRRQSTTRQ